MTLRKIPSGSNLSLTALKRARYYNQLHRQLIVLEKPCLGGFHSTYTGIKVLYGPFIDFSSILGPVRPRRELINQLFG